MNFHTNLIFRQDNISMIICLYFFIINCSALLFIVYGNTYLKEKDLYFLIVILKEKRTCIFLTVLLKEKKNLYC